MLTGTFRYPIINKTTPFYGVIYKKPTAIGLGQFAGKDQTGGVQLTP
jgi:hypothetical protein